MVGHDVADEVAHSVKLGKPDGGVLRVPALGSKQLGAEAVAVFVVGSDDYAHAAWGVGTAKGLKHHADAGVVLSVGSGLIGLNGGGVAHGGGALALFFHVGSAHQFHTVEVSVGGSMVEVGAKLGLAADAVALNRSKHHELVAVELLHGFAGELVDGALNPGFFSVNHEGAA